MTDLLFISTGCPASIGPEISVAAAFKLRGAARVLIGNGACLQRAMELRSVSGRLQELPRDFAAFETLRSGVYLLDTGPKLKTTDMRPGKGSKVSGLAQLDYVETGARLCQTLSKGGKGSPVLVTAAVSKAAIARSGRADAGTFRGHTEWLQALDNSKGVTMCFAGKKLNTALVTTHVAISAVSEALTAEGVTRSCIHLAELLRRRSGRNPSLCVTSLNPHAGEDELLGKEEAEVIVPGVKRARQLARFAKFTGPIGAETALRHAHAGHYDGVVCMYHDQATIPMKLTDFGSAVNVTMGLSYMRTSVDHGTAYDIAWKGTASELSMLSALKLGKALSNAAS